MANNYSINLISKSAQKVMNDFVKRHFLDSKHFTVTADSYFGYWVTAENDWSAGVEVRSDEVRFKKLKSPEGDIFWVENGNFDSILESIFSGESPFWWLSKTARFARNLRKLCNAYYKDKDKTNTLERKRKIEENNKPALEILEGYLK